MTLCQKGSLGKRQILKIKIKKLSPKTRCLSIKVCKKKRLCFEPKTESVLQR
jgi:hypothetical protein